MSVSALRNFNARSNRGAILITVAIVIPLAMAAAYGAITLAGTKTGMVLALLATIGPVAAFYALSIPLIFPFCLYLLLVPFDFLLSFSSAGTMTKIVGLMCGASIVLWLLVNRRYVTPDRAAATWLPYILWAICSVVWAIEPSYATAYIFTILQLFGLYLIVSLMPVGPRTLRAVVITVVLSGVIASLYGIYLFHSGIGVSNNGRLFVGRGLVDGEQIDPNHFGASLLLPIAIALVAAVESRRPGNKLLAAVAVLILGGGIAVVSSRGAMLGIFAILIYLIVRSRKRLVLAGAAIGTIGIALAAYSNVLSRFGGAMDTGGAGRLDIWRVGLRAFLSHPLVGAGFGNFQLAYNNSFLDVFTAKNPYWAQAPHSIIVSTAVELGIIGLLLFLYGWYMQFRSVRIIGPEHPLFPLRTAVEAGLIGLFVSSLFLDTYETKYLWAAFVLMMLTRNAAITADLPMQRKEFYS